MYSDSAKVTDLTLPGWLVVERELLSWGTPKLYFKKGANQGATSPGSTWQRIENPTAATSAPRRSPPPPPPVAKTRPKTRRQRSGLISWKASLTLPFGQSAGLALPGSRKRSGRLGYPNKLNDLEALWGSQGFTILPCLVGKPFGDDTRPGGDSKQAKRDLEGATVARSSRA